jgi:hypothetical protein
MGKPNWISKLFINYPCSFALIQMIFLVGITVQVVTSGIYQIPVNNGRDFFEWGHQTTKDFDLREVAVSSILKAGGIQYVPPRLIENTDWSLQIIYGCKGCDNALTVENVKLIEKVEMFVFLHEKYTWFCLAESNVNPACNQDKAFVSFVSILKGLEGIYSTEDLK